MRAMSLDESAKEEDQNEINIIKSKLESTNKLIFILTKQFEEIKDNVILYQIKITFFFNSN